MNETIAPTRSASPSSTRRAAIVTSVVALGVGLLEIAAGAWFWYLTATDPSDDPLVGLGYLVAGAVAAPGIVAVVLGGLGWLLAPRVAGRVLAVLGAACAALPALVALFFLSPTF